VQNLNNLSNQAYQQAQGVSPQQARESDQQSRAAFASRGRIGDNASVASEILGRQDVMNANRQNASQLAGQALQASSSFYNPGLSLLGGTPASTALGQDYLQSGIASIGKSTPQLVSTGAATNIGAQNASNINQWQQANAASKNAATNAYVSGGASLASAGLMALAFL